MSDAVPKFERLMNLVAFLLASPEPVPFAVIRKSVIGYNDQAREDAVEKRFDRDKKELREIGIPVEYVAADERGRDGYYIPRERYFHHELELTPDESALLAMLANAARGSNDAISANLRSALLKMAIDSPLGADVQESVNAHQIVAFSRGRRDRPVLDNMDKLVAAVAARKTVRFKYLPIGRRKTTERAVHPYGVGYHEGEWYLVGRDLDRDDERQFKVVRIQGTVKVARGRGRDFEIPEGFDIETRLGRPPWTYEGGKEEWAEILFAPNVAWMVRENLRPEWEFQERDDGSGVLRLQVRKSPQTHQRLLHYLAPMSGECAVLRPAWLRKQALEDLKRLRKSYT